YPATGTRADLPRLMALLAKAGIDLQLGRWHGGRGAPGHPAPRPKGGRAIRVLHMALAVGQASHARSGKSPVRLGVYGLGQGRNGTDRSLGRCAGNGTPGEFVKAFYSADFWRQRAEEARALAETMSLAAAKREMEQIAVAYRRLADRAERAAGRNGTR